MPLNMNIIPEFVPVGTLSQITTETIQAVDVPDFIENLYIYKVPLGADVPNIITNPTNLDGPTRAVDWNNPFPEDWAGLALKIPKSRFGDRMKVFADGYSEDSAGSPGFFSAGKYVVYFTLTTQVADQITHYNQGSLDFEVTTSRASIRFVFGNGEEAPPTAFQVLNLQYQSDSYDAFGLYDNSEPFTDGSTSPPTFIAESSSAGTDENITTEIPIPNGDSYEWGGKAFSVAALIGGRWWKTNEYAIEALPEIAPEAPLPPLPDVEYRLTTQVRPTEAAAMVSVTPGGTNSYQEGNMVRVEIDAVPTGWKLLGWAADWEGSESEIGGASMSFEVEMTQDKTVTAIFERLRHQVSVSVEGPGEVSVPLGLVQYVQDGSDISIVPYAEANSEFIRWEGTLEGDTINSTSKTLTLNNITTDREVTAVFAKKQGRLVVNRTSIAGGNVTVKFLDGSRSDVVLGLTSSTQEDLMIDYGTPFSLVASGVSIPEQTQFLKYVTGASLKKEALSGFPDLVDTTDENPTQVYMSFMPDQMTNEEMVEVAFFTSPDETPQPKWSYTINCPFPTVEEGATVVDLDEKAAVTPIITSAFYDSETDTVEVTWSSGVEYTHLEDNYPTTIVFQYKGATGDWIPALTTQSTATLLESNYANLIIPDSFASIRIIIVGGISDGMSPPFEYTR